MTRALLRGLTGGIAWLVLLAGCVLRESTPTSPSITSSPTVAQSSLTPTTSPLAPPASPTLTETALVPAGLIRLTNDTGSDDDPAWSPDGRQIAFVSDRSGRYQVYTVDAEGSSLTQRTEDDGIDFKSNPTWSPDGQRIAFAAAFDVYQIFAFDVPSSEAEPFDILGDLVRPLTNPTWYSTDPAWSPDGAVIAFSTEDSLRVRQLCLLHLEDGSKEQVTSGSSSTGGASWSPDGRRLAFDADEEGNFELYSVNADGGDLRRLTDDASFDAWPSWSPDGKYILFSSNRGGSLDLYLMTGDGGEVRKLETGGGENFDGEWSPDGRYIVFVSTRDGNGEIYRMDAPSLAP